MATDPLLTPNLLHEENQYSGNPFLEIDGVQIAQEDSSLLASKETENGVEGASAQSTNESLPSDTLLTFDPPEPIYITINHIARSLVQQSLEGLSNFLSAEKDNLALRRSFHEKLSEDIPTNHLNSQNLVVLFRQMTETAIQLVKTSKEHPSSCTQEQQELYKAALQVKDIITQLIENMWYFHKSLCKNTEESLSLDPLTVLREDLKRQIQYVNRCAWVLSKLELENTPAIPPNSSDPVPVPQHESNALACLVAFSLMYKALVEKKREDFTLYSRSAVSIINKLLLLPHERNSSFEARMQLKQQFFSFVTQCKMYFVNADDSFRTTFIDLRETIESAIRAYLPQDYVYPMEIVRLEMYLPKGNVSLDPSSEANQMDIAANTLFVQSHSPDEVIIKDKEEENELRSSNDTNTEHKEPLAKTITTPKRDPQLPKPHSKRSSLSFNSKKARGVKTQRRLVKIQENDLGIRNNLAKQLPAVVLQFVKEMISLITEWNDAYPLLPKEGLTTDPSKPEEWRKRFYSPSKKIVALIRDTIESFREIPKENFIVLVWNRVSAEIEPEKEGKVLPIDEDLLRKGQYLRFAKCCLISSLDKSVDSIVNIGGQLIYFLSTQNAEQYSYEALFMHLLLNCQNFYSTMMSVFDDFETFLHVYTLGGSLVPHEPPVKNNTKSIWDIPEPKEDIKNIPGTLETLVLGLTASTFSVAHLNAFLLFYESFTSPREFWEKLEERFHVPPNRLPTDKSQFIKIRCSNIILQWVKKYSWSIDTATLLLIKRFVDTTLVQENFTSISPLILSEFEHTDKFSVLLHQSVPKELKAFDDPYVVLLTEDKMTIAEQLTIIDSHIYAEIKAQEVTDLKWNDNKKKYHVFARNVLAFIKRANYLSHYVAHSVLLQKDPKERSKMVSHLIGVASCLCTIHNYHSLMGILAGLGIAAVDRLKLTWGALAGTKILETYRSVQQYFNPGNAFKLLREELKKYPTAVPYMGCILGDLTFMDEGNPDYITEGDIQLINFPKLHLINRSITEIQHFQKTKCALKRKEPLHTLLSNMPTLTEKELFALSLDREPRQQQPIS